MSNFKTQVTIFTKDFRIDGEIDLIQGSRLTDFMNSTHKFMVVTHATISEHNGKELARSEFLDIQVNNIEIIFPAKTQA